jgi:hypothetical protein
MKRIGSLFVLILLLSSYGFSYAGQDSPEQSIAPAQDGPPVAQIPLDFGVVGGYRYLRVSGSDVAVYDAPRGDIIYRFAGGYDFVTPRRELGTWVEINPGEWVQSRFLQEVYASQFRGVQILGEPSVPFGWILATHFASSEPGGAEVQDEAFRVSKYQLTSFYNAVPAADGWVWYDVGGGRWVRQTMVSKVQRVGNPGISGRWVAVDLYEQNLVAYEGDAMAFATIVSSGLPGNDTNPGVFDIWAHTANAAMDGAAGGYGDYRLENVPYAMYFDGDISLHGTYWHNGFGYRQSRGCVNLTISDARWLFEWLGEGGQVYVYYSQPY